MTDFPRRRSIQIVFVLLLFSAIGSFYNRHAVGEDLSSSYVGCRVLAAGEGNRLYAHDPVVFSIERDPTWIHTADRASFAPLWLLHPYVQTPLWAYSLQPVCTHSNFRTFCHLFLVLTMLCMSGTLWLVARFWAPVLFHPFAMALICLGLWFSEPFQYAMFLTQTHVIFIFLSVAALILAERGRPNWAGFLLALAAAVKITPGVLFLYWLLRRRYTAALSFFVSSLFLVGLTVLISGPSLFGAYLHELSEASNVLLVAFNNQSLAAWWMGRHYPSWELFDWRIHPLPRIMKWASSSFVVLSGVLGGLIDRRREGIETNSPMLGAAFAMVGATMFTPIAWSHYYIVLVIPIMLFLNGLRTGWPLLWGGLISVIYALNLYPVAYGSILHLHEKHSIARSQFYSGVVCLLTIVLLHLLQRRRVRDSLDERWILRRTTGAVPAPR